MSEIIAHVGVDVTVSLGGVTVAQGESGFVDYGRELHAFQPLGQEEEIYRRGHRSINWQVQGLVNNLHAWAFVMGSKLPAQGLAEMEVFKNKGQKITTEDITTFMNDYVDIPLVIEMNDVASNTRRIYTMTGVKAARIRDDFSRGFSKTRMSGKATDLKVEDQDTSAE